MFRMKHPDVEGVASTSSERSFHEVWEPKGWVPASEVEVVTAESLDTPVTDLNKLTTAKLLELAAARGLTVSEDTRKADLVNLIQGSINTNTTEA